ncbi:hypothetical protein AVEN_60529-1 [Araneus ventricosus]|uniref:Uncharacterized protein n=1 Tax=Araneus ventricosus TaxID=182803 RepID=A0A4Y2TXQ2_ARAVE|nr:hypothetical protein AVEN_60529-1 [Araneus ventricosus]
MSTRKFLLRVRGSVQMEHSGMAETATRRRRLTHSSSPQFLSILFLTLHGRSVLEIVINLNLHKSFDTIQFFQTAHGEFPWHTLWLRFFQMDYAAESINTLTFNTFRSHNFLQCQYLVCDAAVTPHRINS